MSLADEFLDDLNYDDPAEASTSTQEEPSISTQFPASSVSKKRKGDDLVKEGTGEGGDMETGDVENEDGDNGDDDGDDFDADMEETEADRALAAMMRDVQNAKNARDIAKLMDSAEMQGILKVIRSLPRERERERERERKKKERMLLYHGSLFL